MAAVAGSIELQPRQQLVWDCPAFEILVGGAKGGGKSWSLICCVLKQVALADPLWLEHGISSTGRAVLFRKTFTRLGDLIGRARRLFKSVDPKGNWNATDKKFTFSNGYVFQFAQLANPDAHEDWVGQEISLALFDQVEEIPFRQYEGIMSSVRTTDPALQGHERVISSANPLGEYVRWVKERFVKGREPEKIYNERVELPDGRDVDVTRTFIPSKIRDNKYLWNDKRYVARLMKLSKPLVDAYVHGDWDVVIGGFFHNFEKEFHVRKVPKIPASWELLMFGDWGARSPACWLLAAIDNDGNLYIIDEIYEPGETGGHWGGRILDRLKKLGLSPNVVCGPLDYEAWSEHGAEGLSPGEKMVQMGLRWFKASKGHGSRSHHLTEINDRLMVRWCPDCKGNAQHSAKCKQAFPVLPGITIDPRCINLIEEMTNAVPDDEQPDVIADGCADHAIDALGYGCDYRPLHETLRVKLEENLEQWQIEMEVQEALRAQMSRTGNDSHCGYG